MRRGSGHKDEKQDGRESPEIDRYVEDLFFRLVHPPPSDKDAVDSSQEEKEKDPVFTISYDNGSYDKDSGRPDTVRSKERVVYPADLADAYPVSLVDAGFELGPDLTRPLSAKSSRTPKYPYGQSRPGSSVSVGKNGRVLYSLTPRVKLATPS